MHSVVFFRRDGLKFQLGNDGIRRCVRSSCGSFIGVHGIAGVIKRVWSVSFFLLLVHNRSGVVIVRDGAYFVMKALVHCSSRYQQM